jgi:hypothetical protein
MAKVIYKYPLKVTDVQEVQMPAGARVLSAQMQQQPFGEILCVWALVETDEPNEARRFYVVGTGNPAAHVAPLQFVGTVRDEPFVWHVFTEPRP